MSHNDEQCAVQSDGTLKEADEITWYNDPNDAQPATIPTTNPGLKGKEPA
jgi:hypothetical protein